MAAVPYKHSKRAKKKQVEEMFDNISHKYDLLNHVLSLNIDKIWRRNAINLLIQHNPKKILDVATGTGDFAITANKKLKCKVVGIDISSGMLERGTQKIKKRNLADSITFQKSDSENLPFSDNVFDAAIVAFGVRNFENLKKGLSEILRVIQPGGAFIVLEFSKPEKWPVKQLYFFYFRYILPLVGRIISKDKSAYTYLPESVSEFPDGERFLNILSEVGFTKNEYFKQSFGIASIYKAIKPEK
jgi:demethylmenaquinone methyltransferase/2-methoxy-6-polyprenyl-1,4-benzoquinol methylase